MSDSISGVILIRSLSVGGAEKQAIEIADGLKKKGLKISILVFYSGGPLESVAAQRGIRIIHLHKRGRWDFINFLRNLLRTLNSEKPIFIYSLLTGANILSAIVKLLRPSLKVIWGIRASDMKMKHYDLASQVTTSLEAKLSRVPDFIIANSHSGKMVSLQNGFPAKNIDVVPNGIDTDQFTPCDSSRKRIRSQWGLSPEQSAIGIVARLDPMKGHETFLVAAQKILLRRPEAIFIIAGDGPDSYRKKLVTLSEDIGIHKRIIWIPSPGDISEIYNGLDTVVSASLFGEGTSNTICEAMACGKVCIVTDVGDSARIVNSLGQTVPPGDPAAISDAFFALERNRPSPISLRDQILRNFDQEQLGSKTNQIIQGLH